MIIIFILIPYVVKKIKQFLSFLTNREIAPIDTPDEKEYEVLCETKIDKIHKSKLIYLLINASLLLVAIPIVFIINHFNTNLDIAFLLVVLIILLLIDIVKTYYNIKKYKLIIKTSDMIVLDNSIINCKIYSGNISEIERIGKWHMKILLKDKSIITIAIPYTSLVKERDEAVRTETLDEIIGKIEKFITLTKQPTKA